LRSVTFLLIGRILISLLLTALISLGLILLTRGFDFENLNNFFWVVGWAAEDLDWSPTDSVILNIIIGILHVGLILFLVGLTVGLLVVIGGLVLLGGLAGLILAFLINIGIFILKDIFGLELRSVPYGPFAEIGGIVTAVGSCLSFLYFLSYRYITPSLGKGAAFLLVMFSGKSKEVRKMEERERKEVAPKEVEVVIPEVFDEREIETGLRRYHSDGGLLRAYLAGLAERYREEWQIKVIRKQLEKLQLAREYLEEVYRVKEMQHKIREIDQRIEREEEVERKRLETAMLEEEVKQRKLRRELERLEESPRKSKEELIEEAKIYLEAEKIVEEMKTKAFFDRAVAMTLKRIEIEEKYPPEVAKEILDLVDRMMTEEG